jgi:hypothetical protein
MVVSALYAILSGEGIHALVIRSFLRHERGDADRNNMYVQVALPALLFAPFRELRITSRNEAKTSGRIGSVGQLLSG